MTEFVQAHLVLADGTVLEGQSFGARGTSIGEVVFNTGMTGYQEVLTDASYYGQIVVQTYPLIGNYGINRDDMESRKSWVRGYVVRECCSEPSNFRVAMTLDTYLKQQGVIAICGINTRKLTKEIRDSGVINGAITTEYDMLNREKLLWDIQSYRVKDAIASVTCEGWERYACPGAQHHVVLLDLGYKHNICLLYTSRCV